MALFRDESQQARATAWLGRILLARPLSFALLTAVAVAIAIAVLLFFAFGEYTRKARVTGILAPVEGVVRVVAPQSGRIERVGVAEGERVERDRAMLDVVDARSSADGLEVARAVERRVRERQRALALQEALAREALRAEQEGFRHRRGGLVREIAQLDVEMRSQASRAAFAQRAVERAAMLAGAGFYSQAGADRERESVLDQQGRLESLRRTRLALARELDALEYDQSAALSRGRAQVAAITLQAAVIDQERVERDAQHRALVAAPIAGTVATILVEAGQHVGAGATLATIIPEDARLEAHLFAPSRAMGFVRMGQTVLLRYVAYPYQKFGVHRGTVTAVARTALAPAELGFAPGDNSREPLYRIKVGLPAQSIAAYGRPEPLAAGMQVEADILLDRRTLIEWVFEPLLSLAGRA